MNVETLEGTIREYIKQSMRRLLFIVMVFVAWPVYSDDRGFIIERVRNLHDQLILQSKVVEIVRIAREVGPVIDEARKVEMEVTNLEILHDILIDMNTEVQQRVIGMELAANESEAALERMYRSQTWDDLNFAQATFLYWGAWIGLKLAHKIKDERNKSEVLRSAQKGFRIASIQLFRPGLVYGGWLGLGYLELEYGNQDRALQIFSRLNQALSSEPDSEIRETVSLELRLLEARTGNVRDTLISHDVSQKEEKILRIELFSLLEESRKTGVQSAGAEKRLKALIRSENIDQLLFDSMMDYVNEISSFDLGRWNEIVVAEYRLRHKDYYSAMQKFESFFNKNFSPSGVDLNYYRYRWAVAAYEAKKYQSAVNILEKLAREKNLTLEVDKAVCKLLYGIYFAREAASGSIDNRKLLLAAAQQFVSKYPEDGDADSARLLIAQISPDASVGLKSLNDIQTSARFSGELEHTAYKLLARDFRAKVGRGQSKLAVEVARQGIIAFQKLSKGDKLDSLNNAILLQMRALVDPNPSAVLETLSLIAVQVNNDFETLRALMWSRLQLYDRLGGLPMVKEFIQSLVQATLITSWQVEILYPWIAEREDVFQRIELARLAHPSVKEEPDMDRRFRILIINGLIEVGDNQAAYRDAREFAKEHTSSANAWKLLAHAAELTDRSFDADRAWKVITDKMEPTTDLWWEGMLSRIRIRVGSKRPEQACSLLQSIESNVEFLPSIHKVEFEAALVVASHSCPLLKGSKHRAVNPQNVESVLLGFNPQFYSKSNWEQELNYKLRQTAQGLFFRYNLEQYS